jgi:hypothetical protein
MPDYSKGKIYTLRSYQRPDLIYVGSTTQSLGMRISKHRSDYKVYKNGKRRFIASFELFDSCTDVYIELHVACPCDNKDELYKQEGEVIRSMDCVNRCIAGRDGKQYRIEHKDDKRAYDKQYGEEHKDDKREYDTMYREQNKEALKDKSREYYEKNREVVKDRARRYYEINRGAQMVKSREYYQNNKAKFRQYSSQPVTCDCGQILTHGCVSRHKKTTKHHKSYQTSIFDFIHS